jgi:hypothetical protein
VEKSNEMTTTPQLLDVIDVAGYTEATGVVGTQKEIAEKLIVILRYDVGKEKYTFAFKRRINGSFCSERRKIIPRKTSV